MDDQLEEIGDAILTPGDESPAGRCPECDTLAYVVTNDYRYLLGVLAAVLPYARSCAEDMNEMGGDDDAAWKKADAMVQLAERMLVQGGWPMGAGEAHQEDAQ